MLFQPSLLLFLVFCFIKCAFILLIFQREDLFISLLGLARILALRQQNQVVVTFRQFDQLQIVHFFRINPALSALVVIRSDYFLLVKVSAKQLSLVQFVQVRLQFVEVVWYLLLLNLLLEHKLPQNCFPDLLPDFLLTLDQPLLVRKFFVISFVFAFENLGSWFLTKALLDQYQFSDILLPLLDCLRILKGGFDVIFNGGMIHKWIQSIGLASFVQELDFFIDVVELVAVVPRFLLLLVGQAFVLCLPLIIFIESAVSDISTLANAIIMRMRVTVVARLVSKKGLLGSI